MKSYSLTHLPDPELLHGMAVLFGREREAIADVIAHIAEVDARKLHEVAGYDSMHAYCVERFHLSEDAADRRIRAARIARAYPRLFHEVAEGRLNLSSVCMLAPHLTPENVDEFIEAASHRSNAAVRDWLVMRMFVRPPTPAPAARQLEVKLPQGVPTQATRGDTMAMALEPAAEVASEVAPADRTAEEGPIEFEMRFTISREDEERFRYAQTLLSHAVPSGDVAEIYRRAIEAVIAECEKRKGAVTDEPGAERGESRPARGRGRHIPVAVRRAVWQRDGGRCTWVSPSGHRCGARRLLEFDHIVPIGRGGPSTVDNVRLRCRAHNQDAAKQVFGGKLMNERRRRAAVAARIRQALPSLPGPGRNGP